MEGDVLTSEAEKLKAMAHSRGLLLPEIDDLPNHVDQDDYNWAVIDLLNEFEGTYSIIQNFRWSYFKYHFDTNWNPFSFEDSYICKPFLIRDLKNPGYDFIKGNCRCPDVYSPCSLKNALLESSIWKQNILSNYYILETTNRTEDLKIVLENLERIDINGNLIPNNKELEDYEKDEVCKESDIILCSVQGSGSMSTDWSEWSGCSTKCGNGVQERVKIVYDGKNYWLAKETRECKIGDCGYQKRDKGKFQIVLRTIPDKDGNVVDDCKCPNANERLVTSEEAWKSFDKWSSSFSDFCDTELNRRDETNVLREELKFNKKEIIGKSIKLEFTDGYYFDCSGHWGVKPADVIHMYCQAGSPILCKRNLNKTIQKYSAIDLKRDSNSYFVIFSIMWLLLTVYIIKKLLSFRNRKKIS